VVRPVAPGGPYYPGGNLADLLSGVFDPELVMAVALGLPLNYACAAPPHAFNLVDNVGSAAAPALIEMLRRISSGDRQPLADAAVLADAEYALSALPAMEGPAKTALGKAVG